MMDGDDKKRYVKCHFDTVARHYDRMNTLLSLGLHLLWKEKAVRILGVSPGERVLDVCGGTADLAIMAARALKGKGMVCLCDINMRMMEIGRKKVKRRALSGHIEFVMGDAELLGIKAEVFDGAMVGFGIRNLSDMYMGLGEIYRVLRPGGRFCCLEFSLPTAPLFRILYDVYSFWFMPLAGRILAGSRSAYTYLPQSIRAFPEPVEVLRILKAVGFQETSLRRLSNGIAIIYSAKKPLPTDKEAGE